MAIYHVLELQPEGALAFKERELTEPQPGYAVVKLKAAALNHRDVFITQGKYAAIRPGCALGSDGCGTVVSVGSPADHSWLNTDVILNPNIDWGPTGRYQDPQHYRILGMPDDGTLGQYITVPVHRLCSKPAHLSPTEAAALPLAGMTAYRALFSRGALAEGQDVLITGFGGGVSQFAFQFAVAAGNRVWTTTGQPEKAEVALQMGAQGVANYRTEGWDRELKLMTAGFHLIVDSSGGSQINTLLNLLHPGGRLVVYGATNGVPDNVDLRKIFWKQLNLLGSTMASDDEFQSMVLYVQQHGIRPLVARTFPFSEAKEAFAYLASGQQLGKVVVAFE